MLAATIQGQLQLQIAIMSETTVLKPSLEDGVNSWNKVITGKSTSDLSAPIT